MPVNMLVLQIESLPEVKDFMTIDWTYYAEKDRDWLKKADRKYAHRYERLGSRQGCLRDNLHKRAQGLIQKSRQNACAQGREHPDVSQDCGLLLCIETEIDSVPESKQIVCTQTYSVSYKSRKFTASVHTDRERIIKKQNVDRELLHRQRAY